MEKTPFSHKFYQIGKRSPVEKFIDNLHHCEQTAVERKIDLHEKMGGVLPSPHTRHIKDAIWELKVNPNGRFIRLFYFIRGEEIIYVHAITKSCNKTKQEDIDTAIGRMNDILEAE